MTKKQVALVCCAVLISNLWLYPIDSFDNQWSKMQQEYLRVSSSLEEQGLTSLENKYLHPYWIATKNQIQHFILNNPVRRFLDFPPIAGTMVHHGMNAPQTYEICYLEHCISEDIKFSIKSFKESNFGLLPYECQEFKCSSNSLTHLFYAAKILEVKKDAAINTIVELGSGYGNLAHIFKTLIPNATLYLIDLPELLSIQLLFLQASLPETPVYFYDHIPHTFEEKAIHLIPIHLLSQISIESDLFISTFALSEATAFLQEKIVSADFFKSKICYLTGQINGWGAAHNFCSHDFLINHMKSNYVTNCQPLHFIFDGLLSYEIVGIKK